MDAAAHLKSLGWAGPGAGLRTGSLQRAILTSKKTDLKGLGAKANESDQWWDNIFSKQLSNIAVGANGALAQINGGVSAAHPVAARNAHRRQFGEKSALEKVFVKGEVLKGNEAFIPLSKDTSKTADPQTELNGAKTNRKSKKQSRTEEHAEHGRGKKRKSSSSVSRPIDNLTTVDAISALPSPPQSITSDGAYESTKEQLSNLSDKALRKQARQLRRETKALEKAAKTARKEKRRLKKLKKEARHRKDD